MDWLAHPIVVATYVTIIGLIIKAIHSVAALYGRVGKVEDGMERVETKVDDLAIELRKHMDEEGTNIARLEQLIRDTRK